MSRVRVPDGVPKWPVGQVVKTEASHAFNIGSNPVRVTTVLKERELLTIEVLDKAQAKPYNLVCDRAERMQIVGAD